jgi:hypothetical protein
MTPDDNLELLKGTLDSVLETLTSRYSNPVSAAWRIA